MKYYQLLIIRGIVSLAFLLPGFIAFTQEKESPFKPRHSVGINIGHEHSFGGIDENGNKESIILPYWGIDYNFQFSRKFAIGLHTDFITESFKVERTVEGDEQEIVERSSPIAPAVMGFYKPTEHWSFGVGMGGEFAKGENYVLNRIAVEYGVEIKKAWEVFGALQYDVRWKAYDTWTIGLGISKSFGGQPK
ncbi:hypothetical protein [Pinibacter soli]|uniref:Outer membrane protein beta-barrel domain-containing protein n=1 Tax=Pinibacter soli TaxID=3044211 RepID=A0ABT6RDG7_9BACT|nr:hypothetical protein [Pinibacter soli]MDI3320614.1 hypothetical protein [Pinibacter soli]